LVLIPRQVPRSRRQLNHGRSWLRLLALTALVLGLIVAAAVAGFTVAQHKLPPYPLLARIDGKVQLALGKVGERKPVVVYTHLLKLTLDTGQVPVEGLRLSGSPTEGGGLTSFGADVLLLPWDGRIYAATSSNTIRATRLQAPDNHRKAYLALANDPRYAGYDIVAKFHRYHDILHFDGPAGRGLLVTYNEFHADRACYTTTMARLDIAPAVKSIDEVQAGPGDWKIVFRTQPCLALKKKFIALEGYMAGGRMAFKPPATVYLTSGDYHHDGVHSDLRVAQDPAYQYGKMIEVNLATGVGRVMAQGLRNPQGIALMPGGQLYTLEHGPRGGDELNLIREGADYGWPSESYGTSYGGTPIPGALSFGRHDRFEPPAMSWSPSLGLSGMALVQGFHAAWDGDFIASSLKDRSLHRIRFAGERPISSERIEIGRRLRQVHQHSDGRLVLWADSGELIFITASDLVGVDNELDEFAQVARLPAASIERLKANVAKCSECHAFVPDDHNRAPSLARVFGDRVAGTPFAGYSDALRRHGGTWNHTTLAAFITDPQRFAPGTSMPAQAMSPAEIAALVGFLQHLDGR
jgi:aldose sugar dehydrogenase